MRSSTSNLMLVIVGMLAAFALGFFWSLAHANDADLSFERVMQDMARVK